MVGGNLYVFVASDCMIPELYITSNIIKFFFKSRPYSVSKYIFSSAS